MNNAPKIIFKTEEENIFNTRNSLERIESNIFNLMIKIGENLTKKDKNKNLLNKKRSIQKQIEDKDKEKINFNIFNPMNKDLNNTENQNNNLINNQIYNNNEKKTEANFEISSNENKYKLKKPLFVEEKINQSNNINTNNDINNIVIRNKIRYNFITCQNLNIIETDQTKFDTRLNQNINNNISNKINFNTNNNMISLSDKSTITKIYSNEKNDNAIKD